MDSPLGRAISHWFQGDPAPGLISVRLHGSHARGGEHRESDVDVAILVERAHYPTRVERSELRVTLTSDLIGALHMNDVDLVILNELPPRFARAILHDGVLLHLNDPDADARFATVVQGMAADLDITLRKFAPLLKEALQK
jgi:predicted nucleotidyltransferase